jgi:hypothetical protein
MTCYDCIHCDACSDAGDSGFSCLKEDVSKCKHFKNKANYAEVVRCKKCKHWRRMGFDPIFEKEFGHCHNNDFPFMCETRPDTNADDFCSYGERK